MQRIDILYSPFHNKKMVSTRTRSIITLLAGMILFFSCAPRQHPKLTKDQPEDCVECLFMTKTELSQYKVLNNKAERDNFIEDFWKERNPYPGSSNNEFREEVMRRVEYCNQWFSERSTSRSGWNSDRGRIYIVLGPPDSIDRQEVNSWTRAHLDNNQINEYWVYDRYTLSIFFTQSRNFGDFRLDFPPPRLYRIIEEIKTSLITGQNPNDSRLDVKVDYQNEKINISLLVSQLFFLEQGDILTANLTVSITSSDPTDWEKPLILHKILKKRTQELLNSPLLFLPVELDELPKALLTIPIIIQVHDLNSKRTGTARCTLKKTE